MLGVRRLADRYMAPPPDSHKVTGRRSVVGAKVEKTKATRMQPWVDGRVGSDSNS